MRAAPARIAVLAFAACAAILLLAPSESRAVTIKICECSISDPDFNPGAILSLGLRIEGEPGENIYGAGISAYGYDESVVDFTNGQTVPSIFHAVAIPAIGAFNGLANSLTSPLQETSIGSSGNRVLLFNGVGLSPATYNPLDPGLDGVIGGGDAQIRISFIATGAGLSTILIGTGYNGDGIVGAGGVLLQSNTIRIQVIPGYAPMCPVPEPNTAVLAGLGLAALAARRSGSRRATGAGSRGPRPSLTP
jgi:hypothetical protein